jgi:mycoredoxin
VLRNWGVAGLMAACGVLLALAQDSLGIRIAALLAFLLLAFAMSPLVFPRSLSAEQAQRRSAQDGRPIVYWRPGCRYCLRLRLRLGGAGRRAHWVNIWTDPAGAAAVRAVAGGNETVPTVVLHGEPAVNPDPGWLRERLARG